MSEPSRVADQLHRAFHANAWHGPSVREVLADVPATQAAYKPAPAMHSIWEIVLHLTTWKKLVLRRIQGDVVSVSPGMDWPTPAPEDPAAWDEAKHQLLGASDTLERTVATMDGETLLKQAPGKPNTLYVELLGITQHDAYHSGQIALLKRLAASSGHQ